MDRAVSAGSNKAADDGITVSTLIAGFWDHAQRYYRKPDGTPTSEVDNMRQALRPLRRFYGETPAKKFGPLAMAALQQKMIELGWCRTFINRQINRVRMCFKWGVSKEMIPSSVYEALRTVTALSAGRSDATESEPVKPVAEEHAEAIFAFPSPQIQAMVALQALTGMRPGEVCIMRGCDVTTPKDKTWQFRPGMHKTAHHGHDRVIDLGPQAREIVARFLRPDLQEYLFSPVDAEQARREARAAKRATPLTCGNVAGSNRKGGRALGARYTVAAYRRAIQRACERAFPPPKVSRVSACRRTAARRRPRAGRLTPNGESASATAGRSCSRGRESTSFIRTN